MSDCCKKSHGIYCTATNCTYHSEDNECNAKQIKVDNQTATSSTETCCSTFELK